MNKDLKQGSGVKSEISPADGKPLVSRRYPVGSRWHHNYGNGFTIATIVDEVDNFRVELAGFGIVQKSWLNKYWSQL